MNIITQMLNVIAFGNPVLVTSEVIAACRVTFQSQPCGPVSKNCRPERNLPGYQYLSSHFEGPISLENALTIQYRCHASVGIDVQPAILAGVPSAQ
jgi:hypothetical protein